MHKRGLSPYASQRDFKASMYATPTTAPMCFYIMDLNLNSVAFLGAGKMAPMLRSLAASRGPGFNSKYPQGGSQPFETPVPGHHTPCYGLCKPWAQPW